MITTLLNAKIKELPKDFHAAVEIDGYEVMVITEHRISVTVSKRKGPCRGSHVVIYNPNPNITIEEVYKKAWEVLETLCA